MPPDDGLAVADLVNVFLTRKRERVDTGELTEPSWIDHHRAFGRVVAAFGRNRLAADLAADDFAHLRQTLARTLGPVAPGSAIQRIRVLFKSGYDEGLLDKSVRYGQGFARPSRKTLRKARHAAGPRLVAAEEICPMIDKAGVPLRAMILLGVNAGFGNSDCTTLPKTAVDPQSGWINYPRPKTEVPRRCPLRPETALALREAMAARSTRPTPDWSF